MRLQYKVLWFDDSQEFIDSLDLDGFEKEVSDWGFDPDIEFVTAEAEFAAKHPYAEYDLILVDYHLGDEAPRGAEFISKVRQNSVYTEIVFYSARPADELWDAVRAQQLEGVYIGNRLTVTDKLITVARQTVRKVLDLNNMRGMILSEVGIIDGVLDDIVTLGVSQLPAADQASGVFDKFHAAAKSQAETNLERLEEFRKEP